LIVASVLGLVLSLVFQLAHCVQETKFSQSTTAESLFPLGWEAHQIEATANFACQCRWLTWFVGGLNHQIEHHLFPGISHIHYPGLAPLVEEICRRHGVQYSVNESLWGALGSHYLFLRRLGQEEVLSDA
jgi:linoleoyl-CoA desaturase